MKPKWRTLGKVKEGRFLMLDPYDYTVWIRGHHDKENKRVEVYKFYDPDYKVSFNEKIQVFVDFEF